MTLENPSVNREWDYFERKMQEIFKGSRLIVHPTSDENGKMGVVINGIEGEIRYAQLHELCRMLRTTNVVVLPAKLVQDLPVEQQRKWLAVHAYENEWRTDRVADLHRSWAE